MKKVIQVAVKEPQYVVSTDVAFAQVDAWFGHTVRDLKLDVIYPEHTEKRPCIVWICGERIEWDAEKKKLAFTFMNRLDILEIRNMTILADRGVLEIAVNEDTACYYVPGNGELVKSIELSGEMEAELFLIR